MKRKISISFHDFQRALGEKGAIDLAKELGLDAIDFCLISYDSGNPGSVYSGGDDAVYEHFTDLRRYAENAGVEIYQTHGRIKAYNYDEEHNKNQLASFRCDAIATAALGAKYCVVHNVHLGLDAPAEDQRSYNNRMFDDFMPHAKEFGIMIATENLGDQVTPEGREGVDFFGDKNEFLNAYNEISSRNGNAPYICTCVDTGHINKASRFQGQPKPHEMIAAMGSSIKCLHLNDNDCMTDQHLVPGAGNIEWEKVFAALKNAGYDGVYNMELDTQRFGFDVPLMKQYAAFSMSVLKKLLEKYDV